jgi:hypothetical protein
LPHVAVYVAAVRKGGALPGVERKENENDADAVVSLANLVVLLLVVLLTSCCLQENEHLKDVEKLFGQADATNIAAVAAELTKNLRVRTSPRANTFEN